MTSAEMCAWWLMTFGVGEVPVYDAFASMKGMRVQHGSHVLLTGMRAEGLLNYVSGTDRPDYFQLTEAGIEAIKNGDV